MTAAMMILQRWNAYQKERFSLAEYTPLIAAFSFSALCYSSLLRGGKGLPSLLSCGVAFVTALLFFLQLRIADEFKDFAEDSQFRPYRPVPRGLVSLRELGIVGVGSALLQLALAFCLKPALVPLLLLAWLYLGLMSQEFFARSWLKARPFTYMWTHMFIMPLVDFYVTACDWRVANAVPPTGLFWFLGVSFFNGVVLEFGRKIRATEDEEPGVETYSFLWGPRKAVAAWLAALLLTALFALLAAWKIHCGLPVSMALLLLLAGAFHSARKFLKTPGAKTAKRLGTISGVWTLGMYLSLGVVPTLLRL